MNIDFSTNKDFSNLKPLRDGVNVSGTNRQNHERYFPDDTLDRYIDKHDEKCICCWCTDLKKKVSRENLNLGPVVGFG